MSRMPTTFDEALQRVADIVDGRYDLYHNIIIDASEYGPERMVALAQAGSAQVVAACAVAQLLLLKETTP